MYQTIYSDSRRSRGQGQSSLRIRLGAGSDRFCCGALKLAPGKGMAFCTWIQHSYTWILLQHIVFSDEESKRALAASVVAEDNIWEGCNKVISLVDCWISMEFYLSLLRLKSLIRTSRILQINRVSSDGHEKVYED